MNNVAIASFRWLETLEKEFDKAFIEFDYLLNNLIYDSDNGDLVDDVIIEFADSCRDKVKVMNSCWSQIVHKSQTIFQVNCKLEAQIVNLKSDLIDAKAFKQVSEKEIEKIMIELHQAQLEIKRLKSNPPSNTTNSGDNEVDAIHKKLENELKKRFGPENDAMNLALIQAELNEYKKENENLKEQFVNLNSEIFGSRLTAKYLEKELAGRIQQIQLFGKNLKAEEHERLWNQLESEINLHRHKTVMKACINKRINKVKSSNNTNQPTTSSKFVKNNENQDLEYLRNKKLMGVVRTVNLKRNTKEGLGISITGGHEHGVPILISDIHENGPAARCELFVGDSILSVNDIDLKDLTHEDAVKTLSSFAGDLTLKVIFLQIDNQNNDSETNSDELSYSFLSEQTDSNNNRINNNNTFNQITNSTNKSDSYGIQTSAN